MEKIIITVSPDGSVNYKAEGVKGGRCYDATKILDKEFSGGKDTRTEDFYRIDDQNMNTVKMGGM